MSSSKAASKMTSDVALVAQESDGTLMIPEEQATLKATMKSDAIQVSEKAAAEESMQDTTRPGVTESSDQPDAPTMEPEVPQETTPLIEETGKPDATLLLPAEQKEISSLVGEAAVESDAIQVSEKAAAEESMQDTTRPGVAESSDQPDAPTMEPEVPQETTPLIEDTPDSPDTAIALPADQDVEIPLDLADVSSESCCSRSCFGTTQVSTDTAITTQDKVGTDGCCKGCVDFYQRVKPSKSLKDRCLVVGKLIWLLVSIGLLLTDVVTDFLLGLEFFGVYKPQWVNISQDINLTLPFHDNASFTPTPPSTTFLYASNTTALPNPAQIIETHPVWGILTFLFTFLPSTLFGSFVFLLSIGNSSKDDVSCCQYLLTALCRAIFGILFFPIICVGSMIQNYLSEQSDAPRIFKSAGESLKSRLKLIMGGYVSDTSLLMKSVEGVCEAAPQLALQLYITAVALDRAPSQLQILTIITSLISITLKSVSFVYFDVPAPTGFKDLVVHFLVNFTIIACSAVHRVGSLVLLFALLKAWALLPVAFFILAMFVVVPLYHCYESINRCVQFVFTFLLSLPFLFLYILPPPDAESTVYNIQNLVITLLYSISTVSLTAVFMHNAALFPDLDFEKLAITEANIPIIAGVLLGAGLLHGIALVVAWKREWAMFIGEQEILRRRIELRRQTENPEHEDSNTDC